MSTFDREKRDRVLRKYCPEYFRSTNTRKNTEGALIQTQDGVNLSAIVYSLDSEGAFDEISIIQHIDTDRYVYGTVPVDNPDVCESLRSVIENPPETDTVIIDQNYARQTLGHGFCVAVNMLTEIEKYVGMTQDETIHEMSLAFGTDPTDARREPTLSLEEFFDGNEDNMSIAPNLNNKQRPDLSTFWRVLKNIRDLPAVHDVRISVHEFPHPDEDAWISAECVYIWAQADIDLDEINKRMVPLYSEGVSEAPEKITSPDSPELKDDMVLLFTTWD
jgi:hypothetical protein